jgi:hypothetical protein
MKEGTMAGKEKFRFRFVDVHGQPVKDRANITVKHTRLSSFASKSNHDTRKELTFTNLDSAEGGRYQVEVFPMQHRPVSLFLRIREDETLEHTFVLPVNPDRVVKAEFPAHDDLGEDLKHVLKDSTVEGNEGKLGAELYQALDDIRKAGLLNLYAKMKSTQFENGRDVFSYVLSLRRVRGERFFANVEKDLRDEVKNSLHTNLFHKVSGSLHTPPPEFVSADSYKTEDHFGNLQLTFFINPQTLEFVIDADIDGAQGIGHIFHVISHSITKTDTHPYDVHEILLASQKLDPGYHLIV